MKRNTIQELNQFKLNDKVSIYCSVTGKLSYIGSIVKIYRNAFIKDNQAIRPACILDSNGIVHENALGTTKHI